MFYISSWTIHTSTVETELSKALKSGNIKADDTVWYGPSGDVVVATTAADLDEEYGDYVDKGTVAEFID